MMTLYGNDNSGTTWQSEEMKRYLKIEVMGLRTEMKVIRGEKIVHSALEGVFFKHIKRLFL